MANIKVTAKPTAVDLPVTTAVELPTMGKGNLAPGKGKPTAVDCTIAKRVPYLAPARPNLPTKAAYVPVPATVYEGTTVEWHGSNGNANLYPRFAALPAGAMVKLGPVVCSSKRLGGYLAPVIARAFANGPVLWGTIANLTITDNGYLGQHKTYLTGHGIIVLA